ncbi:MAG: SAM-dependent methyltransferase, partial [Alphaproteobacteria bacterium]
MTLSEYIKGLIRKNGQMDMGQFMELALSHPEYGYYMTRDPFGLAGDFTTAPEISQMFGEMIGAWAADVWAQMGKPDSFILLECGPGRGTLMADLLRATKNLPGFHGAARVHFLETSPVLKQRQSQALSSFISSPHGGEGQGGGIVWHESLET